MKISDFQSSINSKGVLQNNRFEVTIPLPLYLKDNRASPAQQERLITLRCEAATFPGMSITTVDEPRLGVGPVEFMPHNATLDDVVLTFLVDSFGDIHRLFFEWFNTIVNIQGSRGQSRLGTSTNYAGGLGGSAAPFEVGFKANYSSDITITVFDKDDTKVMDVTLFKAFPVTLPSMGLAWGTDDELIRITIPFKYTDFSVQYSKANSTFESGATIGNTNLTSETSRLKTSRPTENEGIPARLPSEISRDFVDTTNRRLSREQVFGADRLAPRR